MKLRHLAVAFIQNGDYWLMQKRYASRKFLADLWAPIGGHLEPMELDRPDVAMVREIYEETGLSTHAPVFKYMVIRQKDDEIRIQYVYHVTVATRAVMANAEGSLHWIHESELKSLETTFTTQAIYERLIQHEDSAVMVGVCDHVPKMQWSLLKDFHKN